MKAIILAAGRGNRLSNRTNETNKCMLEFDGKPILEYNLDRASEIPEINEIIVVVGHKADDIISKYKRHFTSEMYRRKSIKYVYQWEQKGLVHAIECAKEALEGENLFLMLGDEILLDPRHNEMAKEFSDRQYKDNELSSLFGFCGVVRRRLEKLEKVSKTYAILFDKHWNINRLIEKPRYFPNAFQGTGHCIFQNEILNYIDECPIHIRRGRGEKELPDLIQCAIDDGKEVRHFVVADDYFNINTAEDLKELITVK